MSKVLLRSFALATALALALGVGLPVRNAAAQSSQGKGRFHDHGFTRADDAEAGLFVREFSDGMSLCRDATAEEARSLLERDPRIPVSRINSALDHALTPRSTGLTITLRGTQQLEAFPQAKEAFVRAAAVWEALVNTPVTIIVDVDFGPTRFGQPFGSNVLGATNAQVLGSTTGYSQVRAGLVAGASSVQEQGLYGTLPVGTVPTDLGSTQATATASATLRALGVISAVADPGNEPAGFGPPPSIGFNSNFSFDFEPTDGIDSDKIDFEATAVHEIGHVLGFVSRVGVRELSPSTALSLSVWDLFRFRPGVASGSFSTAQRVLSSGGTQTFFAGGSSSQLSTGKPDGSGGDGRQASHWKDDDLTGSYIGVMDPTLAPGFRQVLTQNDLAALDAMGYSVGTAPAPPSGNVVPLTSGEPAPGGLPGPPPDLGILGHIQYSIQVPTGSSQLRVDLNGSQDIDLFVRYGQPIGVQGGGIAADFASTSPSGDETVIISSSTSPALRDGTYFIAIANFGPDGSEFTVTATVAEGPSGAAPVISGVASRLDGETLTLRISANDSEGDIEQVEIGLFDSVGRLLNLPIPRPVSVSSLTQVTFEVDVNSMGVFPTAMRASVVLIDAPGNRSTAAIGDFSLADPGGLTLSSVSYNGKKMKIKTQGASGLLELEINGLVVAPPAKIKTNDSRKKIIIKGDAIGLNLRGGSNRVRVKRDGNWSSILVLNL